MFTQGLQLRRNTPHTARGVPCHFGGELRRGERVQPAGQVPPCRQAITLGGRAGGWVSPQQHPIPSRPTESGHPTSRTQEQSLARAQKERIQGLC